VNRLDTFLTLPADLGIWLLLGYVFVVLAGARLIDVLARIHFERAQRLVEGGFRYDPHFDHYDCSQGERLTLHFVDPEQKVAVYRAKASGCAACALKASCTPHDKGRHLYRPLAVWAETEVGRFHYRLSMLMVSSTAAVALGAFLNWAGRPGSGLLLLASVVAATPVVKKVSGLWGPRVREDAGQAQFSSPR